MSDNASVAFRHLIASALVDLHSNHLLLEKLLRAASLLLSFLAVYIFYEYVEYLVILDACNYEKSTKKRHNFVRKMANKLEQLSREQGDFYFCFLPMSHGVNVPPTYALFQAIREILNRNSRPASRRMCMSILTELAQCDYDTESGRIFGEEEEARRRIGFGESNNTEVDPLSNFNLIIIQFTREMVIFGVKDLEIMTTLHHLMEGITEDV